MITRLQFATARIKVACINWSAEPDAAPRALTYALADGEAHMEMFNATWADAVAWANMLRVHLAGARRAEIESGRGWADRHGDFWRVGADGLMHTPETRPFPLEHVVKKWGPLRPVAGVGAV